MATRADTLVTTRITQSMCQELDALVDQTGLSRGQIVTMLIASGIRSGVLTAFVRIEKERRDGADA